MIHILNKRTYDPVTHSPWIDGARIFYVGRPSVLGNPFYHERAGRAYLGLTAKVETREKAVQDFRKLLQVHEIAYKAGKDDAYLWNEVRRIANTISKAPNEDWALMCWCYPEACHADVISKAIIYVLEKDHGLTQCWCGHITNRMHYPGGNPEDGPGHMPSKEEA